VGIQGQDLSIQAVSLGGDPGAPSKVAHQLGVDETGRQLSLLQGCDEEEFIAAGGFQENGLGFELLQAGHQCLDTSLVIGAGKALVTGDDGNIQATFGDIDAHEDVRSGHKA
jgi:hypothetical protein